LISFINFVSKHFKQIKRPLNFFELALRDEFQQLAQIHQLNFVELEKECITIGKKEFPSLIYQATTEVAIAINDCRELNFLDESLEIYPHIFDKNGLVAFIAASLVSPKFLEKI
jgi:hypothetical protein